VTIETSALDKASLPDSSGATDSASGGALGDLSLADLKRGYSNEGSFAGPAQQFPMPSHWMPMSDPWGCPDER
jgi:hypothetical protein